jgi:hypothetical protein
MKTDTLSPTRAESAQAQARGAQLRKPSDAPADLFAQLLAASTDVQGAGAGPASTDPMLQEQPSTGPLKEDRLLSEEKKKQAPLTMVEDGSFLNSFLESTAPYIQGLPARELPAKTDDTTQSLGAQTDALLAPANALSTKTNEPLLARDISESATSRQAPDGPASKISPLKTDVNTDHFLAPANALSGKTNDPLLPSALSGQTSQPQAATHLPADVPSSKAEVTSERLLAPANALPAKTNEPLLAPALSGPNATAETELTEPQNQPQPKDTVLIQTANPSDKRPEDTRLEPGAWVSTVAKGRAKTAPPPQQLAQAMEAGGLTARPGVDGGPQAWHMAPAGQPGQLLSQNLTPVQESALSTATLAESAATAGEQRGEQRGGQHQPSSGEPGRVILESPGAVKTANAEASATPTFAESLGEAMGESFESLGAQVSFWAASNTRRASMRLEAGLKEALEVEVTLEDGNAHLAFRTDDPQAREALKANAQQVLSELLAKSGVSLQGMSVDARDAQHSSSGQDGRSDGRRQGLRQALDNVGAAPPEATRLQVKTARPGLSVYA